MARSETGGKEGKEKKKAKTYVKRKRRPRATEDSLRIVHDDMTLPSDPQSTARILKHFLGRDIVRNTNIGRRGDLILFLIEGVRSAPDHTPRIWEQWYTGKRNLTDEMPKPTALNPLLPKLRPSVPRRVQIGHEPTCIQHDYISFLSLCLRGWRSQEGREIFWG